MIRVSDEGSGMVVVDGLLKLFLVAKRSASEVRESWLVSPKSESDPKCCLTRSMSC